MKDIKIALIGNPNSGKTTIFNKLTNLRYKTANYPGSTVEKKFSYINLNGIKIQLIDLPGIYSLSAATEDEKITRDFILDENPDIIINAIDSSNIEKSLFLTTQLLEIGIPILLAFNMVDIAKKRNINLDLDFFKNSLNVDATTLIASKKIGLDELLKKAIDIYTKKNESNGVVVKFEDEIENEIKKIETLLVKDNFFKEKRLFAIKLLEEDPWIQKKIKNSKSIFEKVENAKSNLEKKYEKSIRVLLSERRYEFIKSISNNTDNRQSTYKKTFSDKVDEIFLNMYLALPIFLLIMYSIFFLTFYIGSYPIKFLGNGIHLFSSLIDNAWGNHFLLLKSLVVNGIISGVGVVITFLPNIMILFLGISFLEESGYMTRAAYILDRLMHKMNLNGKIFIPMLIGFGCSVPAIMATRCIDNKKDRILTILSLPLIACSAKLVVFTLLIPIFFDKAHQPIVLFSLYLIGIILALGVIKIFNLAFFKNEKFSFVMELPSYKIPNFFHSLLYMWDRSKEYLKKAGTLILGFSIIFWALANFPKKDDNPINENSHSYLEKAGKKIEPIFKPLGFDWKINSALMGSLASKEVFVSELGIIYSINDENQKSALQNHLKNDYTSIQAFSILLFILISFPCIATIVITKKETKSYKWPIFQFLYLGLLAYIITLTFYQLCMHMIR